MTELEENVRRRIDEWKDKLIDTSKRNRLLYFNSSQTGYVKLTQPSFSEIYQRLVVDEKPLRFYRADLDDLFDLGDADDEEPVLIRPLRSDEVRSDCSEKRLWKTLYSLRQKSRSSLAEQGIVTLFVTFGFLEWTEASPGGAKYRSPLVLVPVDLVRESAKDPYGLQLFGEDEAVVNPTLAQKMRKDFGLTLPNLPELDSHGLEKFFADVLKLIEPLRSWAFVPEIYLGLFSFHKIRMYEDLEAHSLKFQENPFVRALAGDRTLLPPIPTDLPERKDLDREVLPEKTFQVRDADSSQQEAIQAAKRGVSFVLQGPPGTGKSQTIANIISERMAQGKKVLFVSEKMAALQVVHRRLSEDGLGEFCLQAHSHNANKKEVVQELGRTLNASRSSTVSAPADWGEFLRLRDGLNAYVTALHTPRSSDGLTAYQIHGRLAALDNQPDLLFDVRDVLNVPPTLAQIDALLERLTISYPTLLERNSHPWRDVAPLGRLTLQLQTEIRQRFSHLADALGRLDASSHLLAEDCGLRQPHTLPQTERLFELAELVARTPHPPATWLEMTTVLPLMASARSYAEQFTAYNRRRSALLQNYSAQIFSLDHGGLEISLTSGVESIAERVQRGGVHQGIDRLIGERTTLARALADASTLLREVSQSAVSLSRACSVDGPTNMEGVLPLCALAEQILRDPMPQSDWFERTRLIALKEEAEAARDKYAQFHAARAQISSRYEEEVLALDLPGMVSRFSVTYASPFRVLQSAYYKDMRLVRAALKAPEKLRYAEALRDLRTARQWADSKQWIEQRRLDHSRNFGRHYTGLDTDWTRILDALEACGRIYEYFGDNGAVPEGLVRLLSASGSALNTVQRLREEVVTQFGDLEKAWTILQSILSLGRWPSAGADISTAHFVVLQKGIDTLTQTLRDFYVAYDAVSSARTPSNISTPISVAQAVTDLCEARHIRGMEATVQANAARLQNEFGHLFTGMDTRWQDVLDALDWTGQTLNWFNGALLPQSFIDIVCDDRRDMRPVKERLAEARNQRREIAAEEPFLFSLFIPDCPFLDGQTWQTASLIPMREWTLSHLHRLHDLSDWLTWQQTQEDFEKTGVGGFLTAVKQNPPALEDLRGAYYKRLWSLWLDAVYDTDETLARFDGPLHDQKIARFAALDAQQIQSAQRRLHDWLVTQRPKRTLGGLPGGEMTVLERETLKRKRHKPLRQLFREMPHLLLALKPCMMMSPLSVAQFLDPTLVEFDLVIFDEASQICSEDAVGAIMRGKQLIVVGDNKQLPPNRIGMVGVSEDFDDEQDEEEEASDFYDSILDECSALGLPSQMLRWHYRSKRESLIAFSNRHFYEDQLITFPNPSVVGGDAAELGVQFVHIPEGVYEGRGVNRIEARRVAELVFDHFVSHPHLSLGVIAFSLKQQSVIDEEIRRLRALRPDFEAHFREEGTEPFFIKNLENVQGDERDVIFFSTSYGRDCNGKMLMTFGPLGNTGGERRLNVAVTRAKHQVKLISSMLPTDIDLSRVQRRGPALLKQYMEFALHAQTASDVQGLSSYTGTSLESDVCLALQEQGLTVHKGVGCSEHRIDLAVVDDAHPERYVLGIECDGAVYQTSATARDRDRLRRQVLESLGWRLERVWSAEWVSDRSGQIQRLVAAVEAAKLPPVQNHPENTEEPDLGDEVVIEEDETDQNPSMSEEETTPQTALMADTLPNNVVGFQSYQGSFMGLPEEFYQQTEGTILVLVQVVEQEGPIHIAAATRRVVACWGMSKAGSNLTRLVREAATQASRRGLLQIKQNFLWPPDISHPLIRIPAEGDVPRPIEEISVEEIAEAASLLAADAFGMPEEDLINATARLLGFKQTGSRVRVYVQKAVQYLLDTNRARKQGDLITII